MNNLEQLIGSAYMTTFVTKARAGHFDLKHWLLIDGIQSKFLAPSGYHA
jgi:hypothetical protein